MITDMAAVILSAQAAHDALRAVLALSNAGYLAQTIDASLDEAMALARAQCA
jgi:hypothetical protein